MSDNYGWCQSCGALVFGSSQCHKCDGRVKEFCVDIQLVKLRDDNIAKDERNKELEAENALNFKTAAKAYTACGNYQKRIKELETSLKEYGTHKNSCAYVQGLRGSTIEKCDCGFE